MDGACPKCGKPVPPSAQFCLYCGKPGVHVEVPTERLERPTPLQEAAQSVRDAPAEIVQTIRDTPTEIAENLRTRPWYSFWTVVSWVLEWFTNKDD